MPRVFFKVERCYVKGTFHAISVATGKRTARRFNKRSTVQRWVDAKNREIQRKLGISV